MSLYMGGSISPSSCRREVLPLSRRSVAMQPPQRDGPPPRRRLPMNQFWVDRHLLPLPYAASFTGAASAATVTVVTRDCRQRPFHQLSPISARPPLASSVHRTAWVTAAP